MLDHKELRRLRAQFDGLLIFLLTWPLLLKAVLSLWTNEPAMLAANGGGWLLFMLGLVLCRRGRRAVLQERERRIDSWRGLAMKRMGGGVIGLASAFTAVFAAGHGVATGIAFGCLAALGYFLLYSSDDDVAPLARQVPKTVGEEGALLRDAWSRLDGIAAASRRMNSPEFRQRLNHIVGGAERILKLVAEEPRELRRARKFLTLYLDGAHRITEEYARAHPTGGPADLEHDFRTLLVDLQNACDEQYAKLLQHDSSDLEAQIEVLSARLRREGVA